MSMIRDIMTKNVFAIRPETTLAEAVKFLTEHHVGGAPVTSESGELLGVVSELALLDVVFEEDVRQAHVAQYMEENVESVTPDEPLTRAAQLFALYAFRRLPVVEGGKLVGIVSRRDLMNHSLRTNELLTDPLLELVPALAMVH
jgi:CBS domain-containing protein